MTKTLRNVKVGIVMGVLLFSAFAVLIPSSSAGPLGLVNCNAMLKVFPENANELNTRVVPLAGPMIVRIQIGYLVTGIFSEPTIARFTNTVPASISISVEETPEWCTATVEPNVVSPKIQSGWCYDTADLKVSFKQNVPARGEVAIKIKMQAAEVSALIWKINAVADVGTITFTPEYLPIISVNPTITLKDMSPGQVAEFPIELENLGNAQTKFIIDLVNVPEGWVASIPSNVDVGSKVEGQNNKKTVTLTVQPPLGFGYHNDREEITIKVRGVYFAKSAGTNLTTDEYPYVFTITSRGFSTPGFEAIFVVFALVSVALIIKIRQKTKKK
jgi:hypothetical protein